MQLKIICMTDGDNTKIKAIQSGYLVGPDWDWYYAATKVAWPHSLTALKNYLEKI